MRAALAYDHPVNGLMAAIAMLIGTAIHARMIVSFDHTISGIGPFIFDGGAQYSANRTIKCGDFGFR